MCGGAGSLAQQGFLAVFPGRAKGTGEDCFGGKDRAASFFDGLRTGTSAPVLFCCCGKLTKQPSM